MSQKISYLFAVIHNCPFLKKAAPKTFAETMFRYYHCGHILLAEANAAFSQYPFCGQKVVVATLGKIEHDGLYLVPYFSF